MKLFIDTSNIEEIREIASWGVLEGVTTNPSLIDKEGRELKIVIDEIVSLVNGTICVDVVADNAEEMIEKGIILSRIHKNIVIKVPMTDEGLKAIKEFSTRNIRTDCALIYSPNQALLAAKAGASFVSLFVGNVDDIGNNGMEIVVDILSIFDLHGLDTEVIASSIRHPLHVKDAALCGSHVATIPYDIFKKMLHHPSTTKGNVKFTSE